MRRRQDGCRCRAALAARAHAGQLTRVGEPLIDHIERVASTAPADIRALAYLHEVLEKAPVGSEDLREHELSEFEYAVLSLLTHDPSESYRRYVMRIATAGGDEGRIARSVKHADLDDHLRNRRSAFDSPNCRWARAQILAAQRLRFEAPPIQDAALGQVA